MKFIFDIPGQTCNRFWSFLDLTGEAMLKKKKVYVLFPDKSFKDYPTLLDNNIIKFPFFNQVCQKKGIYYKLIYNKFSFRFFNSKIGKSLGFVKGWDYCGSHKYYPQIKNDVLSLFQPSKEIQNEVEKLISTYHNQGYFIIGVHIRQGDYKTWRGGQYYFSQEEYAELLQYLLKLYKDKKVIFYISSNTTINTSIFSRIPYINANNNSAAFDLEALSHCDRIIGPLSTFSRWASLKGEVPLFLLEKGLRPNSDDDFHIIQSLFYYDNGETTIGKRFNI
ncbi:alpha-1,2-fucosyltransferase [Phocaeicola plebeius]|jgi:hypothetical protein|uniref:alpha-1,2-fucosyltransferase n=1 Tax=Phocaeicola plebeius TaxID=310297 RepID=UPI0022E959BB|nr:alpha-1,2-fucosyltransferase [Phocaeicola plebeius]